MNNLSIACYLLFLKQGQLSSTLVVNIFRDIIVPDFFICMSDFFLLLFYFFFKKRGEEDIFKISRSKLNTNSIRTASFLLTSLQSFSASLDLLCKVQKLPNFFWNFNIIRGASEYHRIGIQLGIQQKILNIGIFTFIVEKLFSLLIGFSFLEFFFLLGYILL